MIVPEKKTISKSRFAVELDSFCLCYLELLPGLILGNLQYEIVFDLEFFIFLT